MGHHRERHHRRSIRLKEYDYAQNGTYFVTICTHDGKCIFGKIRTGHIQLSAIGEIATRCWFEIPNHFDNVILDKFVVMPNHLHGILFLSGATNVKTNNVGKTPVGVQYIEPLRIEPPRIASSQIESPWVGSPRCDDASRRINKYQKIIPKSIGSIIRCYKAAVTRWCHRHGYSHFYWQRGFYEHVIRDERELNRVRWYIINNPVKWHHDRNRPDR